MPHSEARVQTGTPARYLGQLCKHFAHKIPVTLETDTGSIEFPAGLCRLATDGKILVLRVDAPDAAALEQVQDVVARHLLRFAFRDPPSIEWRETAEAGR